MPSSIILKTDSYKFSHFEQYPPDTTKIFSYLESRGGKYPETVFFGLQYILQKYFTTPVTMDNVEYARKRTALHGLPFHYDGWKHIVDAHGWRLPLKIRAVPEGTLVPVRNVLLTVENTDPKCYWLPAFVETILLKVWYPITVATKSFHARSIIKIFLEDTADDLSGLPFKLHDFGQRGVSSEESAAIGGAAHLLSFLGTDTFAAVELCHKHYAEEMAGFSIPASEHSTMITWGRDGEREAFRNMIRLYGHRPVFACVSDSFDIFKAIDTWGELRPELEATSGPSRLVVRPDSGNPAQMTAECVQRLEARFGSEVNGKGYRLLHGVRVICGEGIRSPEVIAEVLGCLKMLGYSADNVLFGMGGGLLQRCNRDTLRFAVSASGAVVGGVEKAIFKQPVTDEKKWSRKGFVDLVRDKRGAFLTVERAMGEECHGSCLETVFEDGVIKRVTTMKEIRKVLGE